MIQLTPPAVFKDRTKYPKGWDFCNNDSCYPTFVYVTRISQLHRANQFPRVYFSLFTSTRLFGEMNVVSLWEWGWIKFAHDCRLVVTRDYYVTSFTFTRGLLADDCSTYIEPPILSPGCNPQIIWIPTSTMYILRVFSRS